MSKEQKITAVNSSILTTMFIVFLILKLTGNIDWSWWIVTSPLWIPIAMIIGVVGLLLAITLILMITNKGDV
jgi:hypothetical protein